MEARQRPETAVITNDNVQLSLVKETRATLARLANVVTTVRGEDLRRCRAQRRLLAAATEVTRFDSTRSCCASPRTIGRAATRRCGARQRERARRESHPLRARGVLPRSSHAATIPTDLCC